MDRNRARNLESMVHGKGPSPEEMANDIPVENGAFSADCELPTGPQALQMVTVTYLARRGVTGIGELLAKGAR